MFNYKERAEESLEFIPVAKVAELPNGQRLFVDIGGEMIVVFNIAGRHFAIADRRSHDDGPVGEGAIQGLEIECPRHGARFSLENGKALALPAVVDIPSYPVRVVDDEILVGLPAVGT
jgi:3-phenylpropionate/trans-cinnamate dioxygenase ferredoxin subunit